MAENEDWIAVAQRWASAVWDHMAANQRVFIDGWNGLSFFEQSVIALLLFGCWVGVRIMNTAEKRKDRGG